MDTSAFIHNPFGCLYTTHHTICHSRGTGLHRVKWARGRLRSAELRCCDASESTKKHEPVEDGVKLPVVSDKELQVQSSWLEIEVRSWLDREWPESNAIMVHREIARRTSQLYHRLRAEGIHDLGTLLLGVGSGLEGADFSKSYVGPWTVANNTADMLLRRFAPGRFEDEKVDNERKISRDRKWSVLDEPPRESSEEPSSSNMRHRVASPSLADGFERYRFLQMVLDGSASKALIDGAVAVAMGFQYNATNGTWDGSSVEDAHFKQYGDAPPDILGQEDSAQWTDTLKYLEKQLGLDKDVEGRLAASLQAVLETLHGVELTRIQMDDEKDHAFKKRAAIAKWLHLLGGF